MLAFKNDEEILLAFKHDEEIQELLYKKFPKKKDLKRFKRLMTRKDKIMGKNYIESKKVDDSWGF
jgi:hypothetical protein